MSEVRTYAVAVVESRGEPPTIDNIRQHFNQQGKELLFVRVSEEAAGLLASAGIGTCKLNGRLYALGTIEGQL